MNRALRAATMGVLLLSPVALSACSAGQVTQTATQERDKTGGMAQVGNITIREAALAAPTDGAYARGDDAELQLAIVNSGEDADTLVGITGPGFGGAQISEGAAASAATTSAPPSGATTSPAAPTTAGTSPSTATSPTAAAPTAGAPTAGAPTTTATPTPTAAGASKIQIPSNSTVFVGQDDLTVTLTNLEETLSPGQYLELTLVFQKAGEVQVTVTPANPADDRSGSATFDFNSNGSDTAGEVARSQESRRGEGK